MIDGDGLRVVGCGPERAGDVHRLMQAALAAHRVLGAPSEAASETPERGVDDLAVDGGEVA